MNDVRLLLFLHSPPRLEEHACARRNAMWIQVMPTPSGLAAQLSLPRPWREKDFTTTKRRIYGDGDLLPTGTCPSGSKVLPQGAGDRRTETAPKSMSCLSYLICRSCLILSSSHVFPVQKFLTSFFPPFLPLLEYDLITANSAGETGRTHLQW